VSAAAQIAAQSALITEIGCSHHNEHARHTIEDLIDGDSITVRLRRRAHSRIAVRLCHKLCAFGGRSLPWPLVLSPRRSKRATSRRQDRCDLEPRCKTLIKGRGSGILRSYERNPVSASAWSFIGRLGSRVSISANSRSGVEMRWPCGCSTAGRDWDALSYQSCGTHERRSGDRPKHWLPPDRSTKSE
jgi:hypothetical protein